MLEFCHAPFPVPSPGPRVVQRQVRWPYRRPIRGLARNRPRTPHPDRRSHWFGQNPGGVPHLYRQPGPPGPHRRDTRLHPSGLRIAPEGPLKRHPEEPDHAVAGDCRSGRGRRHPSAGDKGRRPDRRHTGLGTGQDGQETAPYPDNHPRIPLHPVDLPERPAGVNQGPHPDPG